jgi:hypothetical protein
MTRKSKFTNSIDAEFPDDDVKKTWVSLEQAAPLFGLEFVTLKNMIALKKFPVPVYKIGRRTVIDKDVLNAFFAEQRSEGLRRLASRNKPSEVKEP